MIAAAAVLVLLLAACGGGGSDDPPSVAEVSDEPTATETTEQAPDEERDARDILVSFTQCLRDEGFNVPDPDFSASAAETRRALEERGVDVDDPAFDEAVQTCEPELAGILQAFTLEDLERFNDAAVEYAACMRANGVDIPDPDFTQGITGLFGDDLDVTAPGFEEGDEICSPVFDDVPDPFAEE